MQQNRQNEADVQALNILRGLRQLSDLLDEPETGEALDLAKNARTTEQYNILRRLKQSLTQYLERSGDLFYVGFVGHFSSGKSSTINSILDVWNTDRERQTDLNPTDTTITLITHEQNAKSLLGVIREGHVTIRHESVNSELLKTVVLADTPGSGDTQFVEEVARDFLPICDVILFFFSSTSPLDKTDIPLLTEMNKRLKFIPIRFVVTRADEFRVDQNKPVSETNINETRRDRFLGDVLARLNTVLQPMVYTEESFILIDNKAGYNVADVVELIKTRCDPNNPAARISMHGHKLQYFQSAARELKTFFGTFIDDKLRELNKIVSTADQNIQLYNKSVLISNSRLTENWLSQLSSIRSTRERVLKTLEVAETLPNSAENFSSVIGRRSAMRSLLLERAQSTAKHTILKAKLELGSNLRNRIEQLKLWEIGISDQPSDSIAADIIAVSTQSLLPLMASSLSGEWAGIREVKAQAIRDAAGTLRRVTDELARLLEERTPIREFEAEVNAAQNSLSVDLDQFFRNAELYRDGVFSHTTKESISTLGIGARLDALESEFTQSDTTTFTNETMQTLFPDFGETAAKALTHFAALEKDLRPVCTELNTVKIPSPVTSNLEIFPSIDAEESETVGTLNGLLRDDVRQLTSRLNIELSSIVADANRQMDADVSIARRRRKWRFGTMMAGAGLLAFFAYVFYFFINREVPQDILNSVLWNLVAEAVAISAGWAVAKWLDDFPKATKRILEDARSILKGKILKLSEEALERHDFSYFNEAKLHEILFEAYKRIVSIDPDGWNQIAAERIDTLRRSESEYNRLRGEYEITMKDLFERTSSYFSDVTKNLERLNEVAARVKARAIEPSFKLLADTRTSLEDVKNQIHSVEFHA